MNENEIRGYLDSDGRVTLMPPKRKKKLLKWFEENNCQK